MNIRVDSGVFVATKENAMLLHYPNDIIDSLYVDISEEDYLSVPLHIDANHDIEELALRDGINSYEVTKDADLTSPPHCFVVKAVGKAILTTAEMCL